MRVSKRLRTAYATIMGFEVMRSFRKGQAAISTLLVTSMAKHALRNALPASSPVRLRRPLKSLVESSKSNLLDICCRATSRLDCCNRADRTRWVLRPRSKPKGKRRACLVVDEDLQTTLYKQLLNHTVAHGNSGLSDVLPGPSSVSSRGW